MCNAPNHSPSCDCGFGGDTGGRGWRWDSVLTLATKLDAAALYAVGRFLLLDLDDPISARQYLEAALETRDLDAAFDLMALALLGA